MTRPQRPNRPSKTQLNAAKNWQRPLDTDATALVRKKPRRFREDAVPDGLGGTDLAEELKSE